MTNQQTPDRVTSEPVPVTPADDAENRDRDEDVTDRHGDADVDVVDRDRDPDEDVTDRDAAEDVTDRVPDDTLDDRGTFEDPVLAGERNDPDDLTAVSPGEPEYHEPAPQATAFGAATVGGAAAAAAQAGPSRSVRDDREIVDAEDTAGDHDPNRTAAFDADGTEAFDRDHPAVDADRTAAFDTDRTAALDAERADEERAYEDAADRERAQPEEPLDGPADLPESAPAVDTPAETPATAAVGEPITGLWDEGTAQSYRDRWREVQFRFVDDPPAAAREANQLVEEAVGAFTAELSRQKEQLSGWSGEDTEDLRAVVRRHRDFLDRLLGL